MRFTIYLFVILSFYSCKSSMPEEFAERFEYSSRKKYQETDFFYGFSNLDSAVASSKRTKRDILLIFSPGRIAACRGDDWRALELYGDNRKLSSLFVIAYLDLPRLSNTPIDSTYFWKRGEDSTEVKDLGMHYLHWQSEVFHSRVQPMMCFVDSSLNPYGSKIHYTRDKKDVLKFIESGIRK